MLFLAAFFWGSTFVAQSDAAGKLTTFTYLAGRSYVGALALLIVILGRALFLSIRRKSAVPKEAEAEPKKKLSLKAVLPGGVVCGIVLTLAAAVQQYGIEKGATAGEAGFLTALYMFFVPLFAFVLYKKKVGVSYIVGAVLTLAGLYFLCIFSKGWSSFGLGHVLMIMGAFAYAVHIMFIDRYKHVDGLYLSCIQFAVCAVISTLLAIAFEHPWRQDILAAWLPIVYAGVLSSAAGFTLQIYGQKYTPAPVATVIMSLESVIALFTEWGCAAIGLVGEPFDLVWSQLVGCALAFAGIVFAQLSVSLERKPRAR